MGKGDIHFRKDGGVDRRHRGEKYLGGKVVSILFLLLGCYWVYAAYSMPNSGTVLERIGGFCIGVLLALFGLRGVFR